MKEIILTEKEARLVLEVLWEGMPDGERKRNNLANLAQRINRNLKTK
jgi:hypothetical protein